MNSSLKGNIPLYLGVDLTDRYSAICRAIDVCGLMPSENGELKAYFWFWQWDAAPGTLDVTEVINELTGTRAAMLDGPQGLATKGEALRACERLAAAVGKTPDVRPTLGRPFAGFLCSSLDLFAALAQAGMQISPPGFLGGVSEVYPGHMWRILAGRVLPKKNSDEGRLVRKRILQALGISLLPELPTHDENDACVAALLAAAADGVVPGMTTRGIGIPLTADTDGILREGLMVIPELSDKTRQSISMALQGTPIIDAIAPNTKPISSFHSGNPDNLAEGLLSWLIDNALKGNSQVCTYSWAYRHLLNASYDRWSQAYANQVIKVAQGTSLRELAGLGAVRLDAFVVTKDSGLPGHGYWQSAHYDREDWERVLGTATVLH